MTGDSMSYEAKHWALSQTVSGGSAPKVILFFLADWVIGDDQKECWPSVERLVFETGMNRKTIIKALSTLESQGLISKRVFWAYDPQKNVPVKRAVYLLVGFEPTEWVGTGRPAPRTDVPLMDGTENGMYQKRDVPETERPKKSLRQSQIMPATVPNSATVVPNLGLDTELQTGTKKEIEVLPATERAKAKTSRRKSSTTCPWEPGTPIPDDLLAWATANYPTIDARQEFQSLINSALAHGRRYVDWKAAFRTWIGNALKYQSQRGNFCGSRKVVDRSHFAHEKPMNQKDFSMSDQQLKDMEYIFALDAEEAATSAG